MPYHKQDLHLEYQKNKDAYKRLQVSVISDLEALLKRDKIKYVNIIGRVKEFSSLFQKIEAMQESVTSGSPLDEINDVVGVRIILLFVKDLEKIKAILSPTFQIHNIKKFNKNRGDDQFGYESDHYIMTYKNVDGPHYDDLKTRKIELQVRTILMDAWDSVSHYLDYKNSESIPTELRRVFFGLSGMFVVADHTFQNLKESSIQNRDEQIKSIEKPLELLDQEINLDTLKAYLELKFPERWKDEQLLGKNLRDSMYSALVKEVKMMSGYEKIKDLDEAIKAVGKLAPELQNKTPSGHMYHTVGVVRGVLDLYDDDYFNKRFTNDIKEKYLKHPVRKKYLLDKLEARKKITSKKIRPV